MHAILQSLLGFIRRCLCESGECGCISGMADLHGELHLSQAVAASVWAAEGLRYAQRTLSAASLPACSKVQALPYRAKRPLVLSAVPLLLLLQAELAAASSKAAVPSEADAEKVKGLPSLGPKPKSKKADAQSSTSKA